MLIAGVAVRLVSTSVGVSTVVIVHVVALIALDVSRLVIRVA